MQCELPPLHNIKTLFVQKQYRQCITTGEALLSNLPDIEDINHVFIHFYLGLAHDDLARQMFETSRFKNTRFSLAEQHYEEALKYISQLHQQHKTSLNHLPRAPSCMSLISYTSTHWTYPLSGSRLIVEHLQAMKQQIITHLNLVQKEKEKVNNIQAKRVAARNDEWNNSPSTPTTAKKLQPAKSYWSFTPEAVKKNEKNIRLEEGKARAWKKERFQPTKYMILADKALSELY